MEKKDKEKLERGGGAARWWRQKARWWRQKADKVPRRTVGK